VYLQTGGPNLDTAILMFQRWARLPLLLAIMAILFVSTPTKAHTIEVPASKKECFFEDLHTHDQVAHPSRGHHVKLYSLINLISDDYNISSRRWWTYGYRLLGKF
jgi:hypothetical protein